MRRSIGILAVVAALSVQPGCGPLKWLVKEQILGLPAATVESKLGKPIDQATPEELKAAAAELFGEEVNSIEVVRDPGGKAIALKVVLDAPIKQAAEEGGNSLAAKIAENPTAAGLGGAGLAGLLAAWAVIQRRRKLS